MTDTVDVFHPRSDFSGSTSRRASACSYLQECPTQQSYVRCRCSAIDLAKVVPSSKISSWIWSIICSVYVVLCCPAQNATQIEKSTLLHWASQFVKVAYNGACSSNVSFRILGISFSALPYRETKPDDSSRLDVPDVSPRLTCFLTASVTRKDLKFVT
jgi:hypothetical protein